MGNKCPSGFQLNPSVPGQCVIQCPENKGFTFKVVDGVPHCVYATQPDIKISLKGLPAVTLRRGEPMPPIERIQDPGMPAPPYKVEWDRFQKEFPIVYQKVDTQRKINDAFKALQDAENVRDQSPQAYQEARVRYYTLTKGDSWLQEERARIARAEVDPAIQRFQQLRDENLRRLRQQQTTRDVVTNVKDKVVGLRDELKYSVDTFQKQIGDIKNQINLENRKRKTEEPTVSTAERINWFLNVALILLLCIAVYMLFRKLRGPVQPKPTYTLIPTTSNAAA
jgi:hypothetical protein